MGLRGFPQFGPSGVEVGADIITATPTITSPVHTIRTTAEITTINPPQAILKDLVQTYLLAASIFKWTTSGNIGGIPATTVIVGHLYGFMYSRGSGVWYPIGQ